MSDGNVKISEMVGTTTFDSADLITTVQGGTNKKMTSADFLAALGATGSIVQAGSVTGTPVLDPQGAENRIRSIEDGAGIKSSVSFDNGITLEHNFQFDTTGAPLTPDQTASAPIIRSLIGGAGINVSASGNEIQIASTTQNSLATLTGNVTETPIATVDTPVKVVGTWVDELSSYFTVAADGRATYDGFDDVTLPVDISFSLLTASGGSVNLTAYIAINGSVVANSSRMVTASSSASGSSSCIWQYTFSSGDYVEFFVENNSNAVNVIANGVLRVN